MANPKIKNMGRFHDGLVNQILSNARPVRRVSALWIQWLVWLVLSLVAVGLSLLKTGLQADAGRVFTQMTPVGFIMMAFIGAALAAWEAIASSVPGRQTGSSYRIFSALVLVALVAFPFLFFYPAGESFDVIGAFCNGLECVERVVLIGIVPWILLGRILSRNASFKPGWTGAWAGASAFLIGTIAVQLHCPSWDARHMLAAHLFPAVFLVFLVTFVGAFWFSRWRR
jgi:hypothetical protein